MAKVLVRILAVIGGLVVLTVVVGLGFATLFRLNRAGVPARVILEIARVHPRSLDQLGDVAGVRRWQAEAFGDRLLAVL